MEVNETTMFNSLRPLLGEGEKLLCPVYAKISKQTKRMTVATSDYAYISVTNKGRLLMYRFDTSVSYSEIYNLTALIFGELNKLQSTGIYSAELSFLDDNGQQKDINISIDPQPKGMALQLPNQNKYADKIYNILNKLIP